MTHCIVTRNILDRANLPTDGDALCIVDVSGDPLAAVQIEAHRSKFEGAFIVYCCTDSDTDAAMRKLVAKLPQGLQVHYCPDPPPFDRVDDIAVITCFFNPAGYKRLRDNYNTFATGLYESGIPLYTVELAFNDAPHTITGQNVKHVRSQSVLFAKENLLNIAEQMVPSKITKIAFVDCDFTWSRNDWLWEASALLETLPAVQVFNRMIDLDHRGKPVDYGKERRTVSQDTGNQWPAPGGGWAVHRELFQHYGLFDRCVFGAGDMVHTYLGFMGQSKHPWLEQYHPSFVEDAQKWGRAVHRYVRGNIGHVSADAFHHFHGYRTSRNYAERHRVSGCIEPKTWLHYNHDGVLEWTSTATDEVKQAVAGYFQSREEDGIDERSVAA